ncbi:NAD(P)H-binding protein [Paenibacillus solisilvae]|uniref:NAD(P)H-binding protein n=1 Tax=Paenibacillus solisilvae TaxID=2486751 RepID=A0ABW0VQ38_9BACL
MTAASAGYHVLVVGATGLVGEKLTQQLLADKRCKKLTVLVRRPLTNIRPETRNQKLNVIVADLDSMEEALGIQPVDIVFCALGTTIKKAKSQEAFRKVDYEYPVRLARWAKEAGVKKMVVISAMGAKSASSIFYSRVKGEMEEELAVIGLSELHIMRPSLLLGKRNEFRLGEKIAIWMSPLLRVITVGPLRVYRPIRDSKVASAMRAAAFNDQLLGKNGPVRVYENHEIAAAAVQHMGNSAG